MDKILIIDDSLLARRVLEDILKDTYEVITADSGREGIAMAAQEGPDLILLDIEMPDMDGFKVLEILKSSHETDYIPVIFLTGFIGAEYEERGFLCGAVDYIVKPYNSNVVKVRVMTHINLSKYRRRLEKQLNRDMLTNVYNRRGLDMYVEEAAQEAVKKQLTFTFIIVDIDFFKKVNDTYGHLEGDRVLQRVAGILKNCVEKAKGYVARYGGEEFGIVLLDWSKEEVGVLMEYISEEVHEAHIPNENSEIGNYLTVSAGGAGKILSDPKEARELTKLADEALYKSKNSGRDRFTWYDE